jgi:cysteine desulfurase / selenocysteine lyase
MTIQEIQSNEELRRHEFPVTAEGVYLAHGGDSPLPRCVAQAISEYVQLATRSDQELCVYPGVLDEGRSLASRLLNSKPEEVALVGPTSMGLSLIAAGLKFRKHDNILIYHDDYPSNVYPWMALAEKGVQVRLINTRHLGVIRAIDVIGQVDEQTRLVALASCHFITGSRIDHQAIGKFLRDRNILFSLDAIQTLGAFPTTVENVDFLAAGAHKWLLGPCSSGLLYVRQSCLEFVSPPLYGWNNVRCPNFTAQETIVYRKNAQRFEVGSHNLLGLVGMNAGMKLILEIGVDAIAADLLRKRELLIPAIQAKGYEVLGVHPAGQSGSGMVSFSHPDPTVVPNLHDKLEKKGVTVSYRTDRQGKRYIRFSPHFYNTDAELHRALELI